MDDDKYYYEPTAKMGAFMQRYSKVQLANDELRMMECNTNPFGASATPYSNGGRMCDSSGAPTLAATFTGSYILTGVAGKTTAMAEFTPPGYGGSYDFGAIVSYNASSLASYGVSIGVAFPALAQIFSSATQKYRIVGAGIKVRSIASEANTSGICYYNNATTAAGTGIAAGVYNAWSTIASTKMNVREQTYQLSDGITVRYVHQGESDLEYTASRANDAAAMLTKRVLPVVIVEGLGASTNVEFRFVLHLEVEIAQHYAYAGVSYSPISPRWAELWMLMHDLTINPEATRGNSFSSWLSKATKQIGNFLTNSGSSIFNLAGDAASAAGLPIAPKLLKTMGTVIQNLANQRKNKNKNKNNKSNKKNKKKNATRK